MHRRAMNIVVALRRSVSCFIFRVHRMRSVARYFRAHFVASGPSFSALRFRGDHIGP